MTDEVVSDLEGLYWPLKKDGEERVHNPRSLATKLTLVDFKQGTVLIH
jgi:hypothetical protein